jgi:hypothetical protein
MAGRFKALTLIVLIGFAAGVVTDLTAEYVLPRLLEILLEIFKVRFILSGFAGAILAIIIAAIWAYTTPKDVNI